MNDSMTGASSEQRGLDLVVWGATGMTGRLLTAQLARRGSRLRWALAGRDEQALRRLSGELGVSSDVPLIVADAHHEDSLRSLVTQTRMVANLVGPYQVHGSLLVELCAASGTDYVDISGEPLWARRMVDAFEGDARRTGARLVFSCGFDSLPFELGIHSLQRRAVEEWKAPLPRVSSRIVFTDVSGFSTGTLASLRGTADEARKRGPAEAPANDPFLLAGGFWGPEQPLPTGVEFDERMGMWTAPWVMSPINSANLHRSNALQGHPWGKDFAYDEMMVAGPGEAGRRTAEEITTAMAEIVAPHAAETGDAQVETLAMGDKPSYEILFFGADNDGHQATVTVKGEGNPGYDAAAAMALEVAHCVLEDLPDQRGGIWTPGALAADLLIARLEERGVMRCENVPA
ncbi:saccharopine dehydrogenase family protein [Streptomyces sp. 2A115]|uniref:saccharopine dehydrogenase family protein n=1 Tax=Streptomyces sp. 2A115 TaxID=3457439 RepID=UPI003FD066B6